MQPQRLARALRERGHDVSVYAGWLGDRPPLTSWTELDETGMPVRWVVTTPWTAWDDRRNFDNPRVASDFASYLEQERPELVHLHALQSLGAGLVTVAAEAGARVLVTMHDFWWFCARQFLVNRSLNPCCLVTTAGDCPCAVDNDWLHQRNQRLLLALEQVDLVLAPSTTMARALVANGVPPQKVVVNENGLVDVPRRGTARGRAGTREPLQLRYTGGPSELKGAEVLVGAARRLGRRDDLVVTAHGIQPYLDSTRQTAPPVLRVQPPFPPHALNEVLAETDALVLCSVARESHSIATREALVAGVPVVTSDSLGPEEVVEHGVNGLVFPTGDAEALAHSMARLAEDRVLLHTLREGTAATEAVTLEQQVEHLDALYHDVTGHAGKARRGTTIRKVIFLCGIEGAPLRYRARLPAEALALIGVQSHVRHYRDPELPRLVSEADAVVAYRVPATDQVLELLGLARARHTPVFFDVDDLIFDPDVLHEVSALALLPDSEHELYVQGVRRYRTTLEHCDAFIGSTRRLCEHARNVTGLPAEHFPNGVGIVLGRQSDKALQRVRSSGPLRVGYFSGTSTHDADWAHVEAAVVDVLRERPEVQLWLGGHVTPGPAVDELGERVRRLPFLPWTELPAVLRDVDVNLAPLEPGGTFNDAKSAIKWLEAALVETPTIASPTQPFRERIRQMHNGFLAQEPAEWREVLGRLLDDEDLRKRCAARARRDVLLELSPHVQVHRYLAILERGAEYAQRRRSPDPDWEPVTVHEIALPLVLEPYERQPAADEPVAATLSGRSQEVVRLLRIAVTMTRETGLGNTARRALRYARRRTFSRWG